MGLPPFPLPYHTRAKSATKLAIAAFLIPYMFALNPAMIMIVGDEVVLSANTLLTAFPMVVIAIFSLAGIGAGFIGYINGPLNPILRIASCAGGLCLVIPGAATDIIGVAVILLVFLATRIAEKKAAKV